MCFAETIKVAPEWLCFWMFCGALTLETEAQQAPENKTKINKDVSFPWYGTIAISIVSTVPVISRIGPRGMEMPWPQDDSFASHSFNCQCYHVVWTSHGFTRYLPAEWCVFICPSSGVWNMLAFRFWTDSSLVKQNHLFDIFWDGVAFSCLRVMDVYGITWCKK